MSKKIVYFLILCFIGLSIIFFTKKHQKSANPIVKLSNLELKDLNDNLIDLKTYYRKPTIINFWATWCGPCREEFPYFENIYKKYSNNINFIMVSAEPLNKIIQFKTNNQYTIPFAQAQKQLNSLGITSIPITFIYSAEGKILTTITTGLSEEQLLKIISETLKISFIK